MAYPNGVALASYQACGKVILFGEHFVVYGAPALAVPVSSVFTRVSVTELSGDGTIQVRLGSIPSGAAPGGHDDDELAATRLLSRALALLGLAGARVELASTIPLGAGLGSSAALAVSLVGAVARAAGRTIGTDELRCHAHELEKLIHGRPSGLDDAVVADAGPIWFRLGHDPVRIHWPASAGRDWQLLLASDGERRDTRAAVAAVAALREHQPDRFDALCRRAGELAHEGRRAFEEGAGEQLGRLLDANQALLEQLGVCTPSLARLVAASREAGAWGAKLTGAGGGGFVVAVVCIERAAAVEQALERAGAAVVLREGGSR